MMIRIFMMGLFSVMSCHVMAESLYLQEMNKSVLTEQQLAESKEKIQAHKEIEVLEKLDMPPFHQRGKMNASLEYSPCTTCHLSPPHTKSERTRTFMNMHTQFIACESCHFRPKDKQLNYQWEDVRDGTAIKAKTKLFRQVTNSKEKPLERVRALHSYYKITPFYQGEAAVLRKNSQFSQETNRLWKKGTEAEKIERRALIHAPLEEKGSECSACHDKDEGFLDLAELGANTYQANKIYNNIITQFFTRYKDEESRIRIMSILK
ncbi:MAG: hypothetical protein GQ582_07990 [Methyloprofundus sp.]|nr:hypothetical protein [Methyloprofundus sp.]